MMTAYVRERLCNGYAPQRLGVVGAFVRDGLVSRMMLDRKLIRLVCAPSCMGKTTLVYLYAQIVFSFENVLWLDAFHPCVLRDLDNGSLASKLREALSPGSLVVFEDVPWFGSVRKQLFATVCEDLLAYGCEVVVTAIPSCDPFAGEWQDCLVVSSADLLFSDAELEQMRVKGVLPFQLRSPLRLLERVPGVMDRCVGTIERFLAAQLAESRSSFESALTMAIALLGSGSMEDLATILGITVDQADLRVEDLRPYVSFRDFQSSFDAGGFPVNEVIRAAQPYLKRVCDELPNCDDEVFLSRVADTLLAAGNVERATKLMVGGCNPQARAVWLARSQDAMLESANPFSVILTYRSLGKSRSTRHHRLHFGSAWALCQLGNVQVGIERLLALARRRDIKPGERMLSSTLAALYSRIDPAKLPLGDTFDACCRQARDGVGGGDGGDPLTLLWNALLEGDTGIVALEGFRDDECCSANWLLGAACSLKAARMASLEGSLDDEEQARLESFTVRVADAVERCLGYGTLEVTPYLAALEVDRLDTRRGEWSKHAQLCFARVETRLSRQCGAYEKLCDAAPAEQDRIASSSYGLNKATAAEVPLAPILEVKLFGGFEVSIGGHGIDAEKTARQKVRALLALLVLDAGKDISCERLEAMLWPDSPPDKARRNFYSIFSMLNRALKTPDGESPYLSRTQGICRLDAASLRSDVSDLLETCNQMRFGKPTSEDAYLLLEQMRFFYRGELLPGEAVVPAIEAARAHWRNRVVDSVVFAARELQGRGEVAAALEYAKQAVEFDHHREDCYELLMVLQMGLGQRTGAVETYFTYTHMNKELGLGVSNRMRDLYNCIIRDEPLEFGRGMLQGAYA